MTTACLIAFAQGRVLSYVRNDIGAASPGLWQTWQFLCNIGSTSLLKDIPSRDTTTGLGPLRARGAETCSAIVVAVRSRREMKNRAIVDSWRFDT